MAWQVFDYYDEEGNNVIDIWLQSFEAGMRARVFSKLQSIRIYSGDRDELPGMVTPTRESRIKEIVFKGRISPRVFLCKGPGDGQTQVTLLGGGQEKDREYLTKRPHITPEAAEIRRRRLFTDPEATRKPHEFPEDNVE